MPHLPEKHTLCPFDDYKIPNKKENIPTSLCPGIRKDGEWKFAASEEWTHKMTNSETGSDFASVTMESCLDDQSVITEYKVDKNGVSVAVNGTGDVAYMLPAFSFDGRIEPEITAEECSLTISYEGWICRYTTNGKIIDSGKTTANRNGCYRVFYTTGEDTLAINIEIVKK